MFYTWIDKRYETCTVWLVGLDDSVSTGLTAQYATTGGKLCRKPWHMSSTMRSSHFHWFQLTGWALYSREQIKSKWYIKNWASYEQFTHWTKNQPILKKKNCSCLSSANGGKNVFRLFTINQFRCVYKPGPALYVEPRLIPNYCVDTDEKFIVYL